MTSNTAVTDPKVQESIDMVERWAMQTAEKIAPGLFGLDLKRVAIGLIQARGEQCQLLSGLFATGEGGQETKMIASRLGCDANGALAIQFSDWNKWLQDVAAAFAERVIKETTVEIVQ